MVIIFIFAFSCIFMILSGSIVIPMAIGVQRNKVNILSIYFELPHSEVERVFRKCLYFMAKIEPKLDDSCGDMHDEAKTAKLIIKQEEHRLR